MAILLRSTSLAIPGDTSLSVRRGLRLYRHFWREELGAGAAALRPGFKLNWNLGAAEQEPVKGRTITLAFGM
jgi:hypothetical protein